MSPGAHRAHVGAGAWLLLAAGLGCGPTTTGQGGGAGSSTGTDGEEGTAAGSTTAVADSTGHGTAAGSTAAEPATSTGEGSTGEPALDDVLRLHHVQVKGTHNSYHVEPVVPLHPSHEYTHAPLAVQLQDQGVRAFELDLHREFDGAITVYHIAAIDPETTCASFQTCLTEIKGWSDEHPLHLPVVVWLEIKDDTGGLPLDDAERLDELDAIVTGVFGPEQLLTPDDVQADYPTLRARLAIEGWPTLAEVRGQVMVVILDTDTPAEVYTSGYSTLQGRAMFVRVDGDQFDLPYAAIAKLGAGDAEGLAAAFERNILVATNVCGADESDDSCFAQRDEAVAAGVHMLKDDFPAPVPDRDYWLDLPEGNPAQCNPVTAPPRCTAQALEDL